MLFFFLGSRSGIAANILQKKYALLRDIDKSLQGLLSDNNVF